MIVFIQRIVHNPRRSQQMGLQMAVSPSKRQFVSPAVSKWQSLSAEDSLLTFSQQGLQMAVFFSRRQFDPRQKSANGSLFQQKTVYSLSHNRVYKWQSFSAEDSLIPGRSQQMAVFFSRRQFAHFHPAGSTNGSLSQ